MKKHLLFFGLLLGFGFQSLAATFVVDNAGDTDDLAGYTLANGTNTLRKCIRLANANANAPIIDIIQFNLAGIGPFTITLNTNLPNITEPVDIDGFSQPGASRPNPILWLAGSGAPAAVSPINVGFYIANTGQNSKIRGFGIYRTQNDGIFITGATGCFIEGCWVGLDNTANQPAVQNNRVNGHGIYLNAAPLTTIGGINGRNVISGNMGHGIVILSSSGTVLTNNYIGTSTNGNTAIGNGIHGVTLDQSTTVIIGSTSSTLSNLISGNSTIGINITNSSHGYVILGNKIGTDLSGMAALANKSHGINVFNSSNGIIGTHTGAGGNLISGNSITGIVIYGNSNFTSIKNNTIGTNINGTAAIRNGTHGIAIYDYSIQTTIGGTNTNEGNLISGNGFYGINIDVASNNSLIQGNKIGTNAAGNAAIANLNHGIYVSTTNGTIIGGASARARNIISGNGDAVAENGIALLNSNGTSIKGNFIGINAAGTGALGNYDSGISISNCAFTTIGGPSFAERNVISGHNGPGGNLGIFANNVDNSLFQRNFIGTDSTGLLPIANKNHGLHTEVGSDRNRIVDNVVSGNLQIGLDLIGLTNSVIQNNFIGLGYNGTTKVANGTIGLRFGSYSSTNTIGGTTSTTRNYIAGNGNHGILLDGESTFNIFRGNFVGTDTTGLVAMGNNNSGIILLDNSNNNTIGGTGANEGNLFCCSLAEDGIRGQISANTTIVGNLIGTNKNGVPATGFGNFSRGIWLMSYAYLGGSSSYTKIGGLLPGESNTITNNGQEGVRLSDYGGGSFGTKFNPIIGNKIYCNGGAAINFENNNLNENENLAAPNVTSSTTNSVSGTGINGNVVHVYRNSYTDGARCDCEGEIYVGAATVAGGTWSLVHNLGLSVAQALSVTATQTNSNQSTSRFWVCTAPLPIEYLNLTGKMTSVGNELAFTVRNERNVYKYVIERKEPNGSFESLTELYAETQTQAKTYHYTDANPFTASLYRIKVVEYDGKTTYSNTVRLASNHKHSIAVYPNPTTDKINIQSTAAILGGKWLNPMGQTIGILEPSLSTIDISDWASGIYLLQIETEAVVEVFKIEKQ